MYVMKIYPTRFSKLRLIIQFLVTIFKDKITVILVIFQLCVENKGMSLKACKPFSEFLSL